MITGFCVFEYLYRDAANYKAYGSLLLSGTPSSKDDSKFRKSLESSEYFVAEQVDIPSLYRELWDISGGQTSNDHALHEFISLRCATESDIQSLPHFGELQTLLTKFQAVAKWNYALSPNYETY